MTMFKCSANIDIDIDTSLSVSEHADFSGNVMNHKWRKLASTSIQRHPFYV